MFVGVEMRQKLQVIPRFLKYGSIIIPFTKIENCRGKAGFGEDHYFSFGMLDFSSLEISNGKFKQTVVYKGQSRGIGQN